ncbi:Telomeric pathways with STn1 [Ancistrocladus abbreviatus]
MASPSSGALVVLQELNPSSPHFKHGASLRVTGKLHEYSAETALAVIADGSTTLKIDTQHLSLNFRVGSIYQFIGELHIQPENEVLLKARVARNVDGMDLNLYRQSLHLLTEFQAGQFHGRSA